MEELKNIVLLFNKVLPLFRNNFLKSSTQSITIMKRRLKE